MATLTSSESVSHRPCAASFAPSYFEHSSLAHGIHRSGSLHHWSGSFCSPLRCCKLRQVVGSLHRVTGRASPMLFPPFTDRRPRVSWSSTSSVSSTATVKNHFRRSHDHVTSSSQRISIEIPPIHCALASKTKFTGVKWGGLGTHVFHVWRKCDEVPEHMVPEIFSTRTSPLQKKKMLEH